jgi:hypothetical protein
MINMNCMERPAQQSALPDLQVLFVNWILNEGRVNWLYLFYSRFIYYRLKAVNQLSEGAVFLSGRTSSIDLSTDYLYHGPFSAILKGPVVSVFFWGGGVTRPLGLSRNGGFCRHCEKTNYHNNF